MDQLAILNQYWLISAGRVDKKCVGELVHRDALGRYAAEEIDDGFVNEPGIVVDCNGTKEKGDRKPVISHEETGDDERLSLVVVVRSGVGSAAAKVRGTSVVEAWSSIGGRSARVTWREPMRRQRFAY